MRALALSLLLLAPAVPAQWQLQDSHTTASLRGIHALGNGVAWASGTRGTVLHTIDHGAHWLACPVPNGAEALDFRGIQAADACQTLTLLFTNPDPEGFWDAIRMRPGDPFGVLLGLGLRGSLT